MYIVGALALIVIIGGGYFVATSSTGSMESKDAMMQKDDSMMKDDAMKKDAMMKDESMKKDGDMMDAGGAMVQSGSYEAYAPEKIAQAANGKVVLFFRASWCPTCRAVDADIRSHLNDIPKGVTILDVNYDDSTLLKQKYGVTHQHTFVQVDKDGAQLAKWSGSPTLTSLVGNIK